MDCEQELRTHVLICEERHDELSRKIDGVHNRLDTLNGRWWSVMRAIIALLIAGLASTTGYIWVSIPH
jgi:hypothetical protein